MSDETFAWRLPLGSLMPATVDAGSGERFPGNSVYDPYTGRRLGVAHDG